MAETLTYDPGTDTVSSENNLTPDEHFMKAHPDGTNNVDKEFQTELLLKKLNA